MHCSSELLTCQLVVFQEPAAAAAVMQRGQSTDWQGQCLLAGALVHASSANKQSHIFVSCGRAPSSPQLAGSVPLICLPLI
jgi:hypothetical protein